MGWERHVVRMWRQDRCIMGFGGNS
jgi:hypothetical protein